MTNKLRHVLKGQVLPLPYYALAVWKNKELTFLPLSHPSHSTGSSTNHPPGRAPSRHKHTEVSSTFALDTHTTSHLPSPTMNLWSCSSYCSAPGETAGATSMVITAIFQKNWWKMLIQRVYTGAHLRSITNIHTSLLSHPSDKEKLKFMFPKHWQRAH